ncbi:MAG TPA: SufS family cysteine desulfurase [Gemmatimonadaceae bacterium]|nr:SufS family cysteine desulfurase [Gemmatimonadaceae bacterium]
MKSQRKSVPPPPAAPAATVPQAAPPAATTSRETMPRTPRIEPKTHRSDFPILATRQDLHYLDSAATSQKPKVVLDAIRAYYENDNANPHRGAYDLSARATQKYLDARERVADFLGVIDTPTLIFTRGTTEALNLVATAWGRTHVRKGDEIVVTAMEHHANFVPWQQLAIQAHAKLRICELTPDGRIDVGMLTKLLGSKTKVVAFSHVSNALGTINPVADIVELVRTKAPHAIAVVDGAQAAPHLRVRIEELGVDFYAFSGHKMLGPMGVGGLVGRRALLEEMPPYQMGGDMIEFVGDDRTTWNVLPHKFEAGTPNVADAVGLAAACDYLDGIGMDQVRAHEVQLVANMLVRLAAVNGVRTYGPADLESRSGVVSFTVDGIHPHDLSTVLDQAGVCIRAGHHCAQPLMRRLDVPATARASVYVYNDTSDVDALIAGIERAKALFGT